MSEIAKLLDALTPRQFEQLLYEAEKRGLVSRRVAVGVVDVNKPKQEPVKLYYPLYYPEPEYYSGKVVCVESNGDFTVGKLYEFKDGKVVDDNGNMRPMSGDRVTTLEDWNSNKERSRLARFIEFKG